MAETRGKWVGRERLISLRDRAMEVMGIDGVFVECGVARGCSATVLAHMASAHQPKHDLYLLDNFAGLPNPTAEDGDSAKGKAGACKGDEDDVRRYLAETVPDAKIAFMVGDFADTAKVLANELKQSGRKISLLHLDGDWYQSTKVVLDALGTHLAPGAVVLADDYGYWEGCKKAVDEWFHARGLDVRTLNRCDYQAWWRTPSVGIA